MDTTLPEPDAVQADESAFFKSVERRDAQASQARLEDTSTDDVVHAVSSLPEQDRTALFEMLPAKAAGELIRHIPESPALEALESLDTKDAEAILTIASRLIDQLTAK